MKPQFMRFAYPLLLLPLLAACAPVVLVGAGATGAIVAEDRRTAGIQLEDQSIEIKAGLRIGERHP